MSHSTSNDADEQVSKLRLALFLPFLGGGGAEGVMVRLSRLFVEQGYVVDLVLARVSGPLVSEVDSRVRIVDLGDTTPMRGILRLARYLRTERPAALLSTLTNADVAAIIAGTLAGFDGRVVARIALDMTHIPDPTRSFKAWLIDLFARGLYRRADSIIAISEGVADSMTRFGVRTDRLATIPNPVDRDFWAERAAVPLDAPIPGRPLFVTVGRLHDNKDHPVLLRAFAKVLESTDAGLIILGEGPRRTDLEDLADDLSISHRLSMPGWVPNPAPFLAECDVFVMSSVVEGYANAIVEALACGAKVVSTDCRSGPSEILGNGRRGTLVPVGDHIKLAEAMLTALVEDRPTEEIDEFLTSLDPVHICREYLNVLVPDPLP